MSYLADEILLFRNYERGGTIHHALAVVKRRSGPHLHAFREFTIGPEGIRLRERGPEGG